MKENLNKSMPGKAGRMPTGRIRLTPRLYYEIKARPLICSDSSRRPDANCHGRLGPLPMQEKWFARVMGATIETKIGPYGGLQYRGEVHLSARNATIEIFPV